MRGIWNNCPVPSWKSDYSKTSASIQSTNLYNKNTWHLLPDAASLNTDHYKNSYKCVQNVILTGVYFSYCCSLNQGYIYKQLMWQWSALSITRRERKQTSYYRKAIILLNWSSKQAWWFCMGADFNCTTSYRPFMGLLYIKCYDHFWNTIYTRDSWSLFWCTTIWNLTISMYHQ